MLRVRLLGQFDVRLNDAPVDIPSRPAQSLLAYLILFAGTPHRRERLAGLLWPDASEANARSNLRHAVWRLRRALGAGERLGQAYIEADNFTVTFNPDTDYWLDTAALERVAPAGEIAALVEAVSVYRGELLPGFYFEWVQLERDRLHTVYERQMQALLDRLVEASQWAEVLTWAEQWIALGQAPERAYRALMLAHNGLGDQAGVAQVFQRCREALLRDLAVEPSDQTRALYERLCRPGAPPRPADLAQSAPRAAAASLTPVLAENPPASPRRAIVNLPTPVTKFVGREREMAEVKARLHNPGCRLLTLTGPGGIGKSRLALQAALNLAGELAAHGNSSAGAAFSDGVFFVPLAGVSSSEFLVSAIAEALRFSFYGGDDVRVQLLAHLRDQNVLLVLDNFEHLLDGASLLADVLSGAPGVKFLVTSQERINLHGEWLLEVDGMTFPVGAVAAGMVPTDYAAVQLFVECARRVESGFSLTPETLPAVLRICQAVAGMPLGLELAAAWVRSISPAEVARELERSLSILTSTLRDVPERHRSLEAVFAHSWQRLSDRERTIYRRLSLFGGGFEREAAQEVAGASLADLSALVDKSLLRRSADGRYGMHGLLRKYAQAKLKEAGEVAPIRDAHLAYFHTLTLRADPGLRGDSQLEWLTRLETEYDNLRMAMKWAMESESVETGQEMAGALARFWYLRGYWQEGRDWLAHFLSGGPSGDDLAGASSAAKAARAKALMGAGWLADETGAEGPLYEESLKLARATGDRWGEALSLRGVGVRRFNDGDSAQARAFLEESRGLFTALGDSWGDGLVCFNLGWVTFEEDDPDGARELWSAALQSFRQSGDRWGAAVTLGALSYMARLRDEYVQAGSLSEEGLLLFRELGDKAGIAVSLVRLAQLAFRRGSYPQAIDLIDESLALVQDLGDKRNLVNGQTLLGLVYGYQGQYAQAHALLDESEALGRDLWGPDTLGYIKNYRALVSYLTGELAAAQDSWETALSMHREQEDKLGTAASLWGLGLVAYHQADWQRAGELLEYSLALFRELKDRRYIALVLNALSRLAASQGELERARMLIKESLFLRKELGDRQGLAEGLETLASQLVAGEASERHSAARLLGAAHALRQAIGAPVPAVDRRAYEALMEQVRGVYAAAEGGRLTPGEIAFTDAWNVGEALAAHPPEKLLEQALAGLASPPATPVVDELAG